MEKAVQNMFSFISSFPSSIFDRSVPYVCQGFAVFIKTTNQTQKAILKSAKFMYI